MNQDPKFAPGALLVFAPDPSDRMDSPKILVRGISNLWKITEGALPFYLRAAEAGGFVWLDRDGLPWHFHASLRIESRRRDVLEISRRDGVRSLWTAPDEELQRMVGMALPETTGDPSG